MVRHAFVGDREPTRRGCNYAYHLSITQSPSLYSSSPFGQQIDAMHDACALNGAPNPPCVDTEPMSAGTQVLLQGFTWESHAQRNPGWYKVLLSKAETIAKAGITAVWLPPPSQSVSSEGYMPRELDNLDSAYGSEQDLRACIDGLHRAGIQCLCDVVLNHRCASSTDATGRWNQYGGRYAWDSSAICR